MGSYVPNSPAVRQEMLEAMGASGIRDLYANVPEEMFVKELDLPAGKSELEVRRGVGYVAAHGLSPPSG